MRVHPTHLIAALLFACAACDQLPSSPPSEEQRPNGPIQIGDELSFATDLLTNCFNEVVPEGYVVLGQIRTFMCPDFATLPYNAYRIGLPGSPEVVCAVSTIPPGWVISTYHNGSVCPNYVLGRNRVEIKIPGPREIVCTDSYVPPGYLTVRYVARGGCPSGEAKIIQSPVSTATVCSSNTVPANWIIFAYYRLSYCPPGGPEGFNVFKIGPPSPGLSRACSVSNTPNGYVIRSYTRDVRCPGHSLTGFNAVAFSLPANGMLACRSQTLPTGWYFDRYSNSSACYSHATGQNQGRLHHD